jgi:hypothetical protein
MNTQEKSFEWFKTHIGELYKEHGAGKFLAIKDCHVIGVYDSFKIALDTTKQTEKRGSFIVQENVPDISYCTIVYHPRVSA